MDKGRSFAGQPFLSQILDVIPSSLIYTVSRKHQANRYYKRLPFRTHFVSLMYGVFSYCNGIKEMCEGLLGFEGKLLHLDFDKAPARSTFSNANTNRSFLIFTMIYEELLKQYHSFTSDSRLKGLSIGT